MKLPSLRFLARPLTQFVIFLGVVAGLAINFAVGEASKVGWVIVGILVSTVLQVAIEAYKKQQEAIEVAKSLYEELADRVARCLFDFEQPWASWYKEHQGWGGNMDERRLRKFMPISPVIYPALAAKLSMLGDNVPQPVIAFYTSLTNLQQDMMIHADQLKGTDHALHASEAGLIADRFHRTLGPGLEALEELGKLVERHEIIDAVAIARRDKLFNHAHSGQPLRDRLSRYVSTEGPYPIV